MRKRPTQPAARRGRPATPHCTRRKGLLLLSLFLLTLLSPVLSGGHAAAGQELPGPVSDEPDTRTTELRALLSDDEAAAAELADRSDVSEAEPDEPALEAAAGPSDQSDACEAEPDEPALQAAAGSSDRSAGENGTDELTAADLLDELDLRAAQESLREMTDITDVSFTDLVKSLLRGEIPFDIQKLPGIAADLLLAQLLDQKELAAKILAIVLISSVCSNFIRVFENAQIAEIGFYMMYLMIATLLIRSFSSMSDLAAQALGDLNNFIRVLLPPYLVTIVFSSGSVLALGFYQVSLLTIHILQVLVIKIILPLIRFYLVLLVLNQMTAEDYFSRSAELLRTVIEWGVKTVTGIAIGLQAVQCLTAPAVDSLKNSAAHRLAKTLPGIGSILDAAAETVLGSALVIKNAVGVAGMLAVLLICLVPFLKLAANVLLFRLLMALIQPISEKRMVGCIESMSAGASMLLRILLSGMSIFLISLAMITASVRGG